MEINTCLQAGDFFMEQSDFENAKRCYENASEEDSGEAFFKLGNLYFFGTGVEQNYYFSIEKL